MYVRSWNEFSKLLILHLKKREKGKKWKTEKVRVSFEIQRSFFPAPLEANNFFFILENALHFKFYFFFSSSASFHGNYFLTLAYICFRINTRLIIYHSRPLKEKSEDDYDDADAMFPSQRCRRMRCKELPG